jgi:hypothetical protein
MDYPYTVGRTLRVTTGRNEVSVLRIEEILSHNHDFIVLKVICEDIPDCLKYLKDQTTVLKLYDRRYAHEARRIQDVPPYRPLLEQMYRDDLLENPPFRPTPLERKKGEEDTKSEAESDTESIFDVEPISEIQVNPQINTTTSTRTRKQQDKDAENGYKTDDTEDCNENDSDHENDAVDEGDWTVRKLRRVQYGCIHDCEQEIEVYKILKPLQGTRVPRFYSTVLLQHSPWTDIPENATLDAKVLFCIPGILIEFIPGEKLWNSFVGTRTTHGAEWENTLHIALDTVNHIYSYPIICIDAQAENIIMRKRKEGGYEAVMFDFAYSAHIREWHETDEIWGTHKWIANEEGKIGRPIAQHLGLFFEESAAGTYRWHRYHRTIRLPPVVNPHLRPIARTYNLDSANDWGSWAIALPSLLNPSRYPVIRTYDYNAEEFDWENFNWEDYDLPVDRLSNKLVAIKSVHHLKIFSKSVS